MPMPTPMQHVNVLMLENRAFDHLFGFMPEGSGLKGDDGNFELAADASSRRFNVGQAAPFAIAQGEGPAHSVNAATRPFTGTRPGPDRPADNSGFVRAHIDALPSGHVAPLDDDAIGVLMQRFAPGGLPSLQALAGPLVLRDGWFADVPGPTQTNRLFVHAAPYCGYAHDCWSKTFDRPTVDSRIEEAGLSRGVSFSDDNDVARFSRLPAKACANAAEQTQWEADRAAGAYALAPGGL